MNIGSHSQPGAIANGKAVQRYLSPLAGRGKDRAAFRLHHRGNGSDLASDNNASSQPSVPSGYQATLV